MTDQPPAGHLILPSVAVENEFKDLKQCELARRQTKILKEILSEENPPLDIKNWITWTRDMRLQMLSKMASRLGISSLRYLPIADLGTSIGCEEESLCLGCVTAKYPTTWGRRLMRRARQNRKSGVSGRTYES